MSDYRKIIQKLIKCERVSTIKDINDQFDYEDTNPRGRGDNNKMACGQDGSSNGYNELERFFDTHLADKFEGLAQQSVAIKAMCECCHEISHQQRTHEAFKACVSKKLNIKID